MTAFLTVLALWLTPSALVVAWLAADAWLDRREDDRRRAEQDRETTPEWLAVLAATDNGNYEASNCRWATVSEQNANLRPREACRAGHAYTPENTRTRSKPGGRRVRQCITCADALEASRSLQRRAS